MTRIRLLRAIEALAWTAFFVVALAMLALRYWALPNVERYRADIVAAISSGIGLPVKVGAIEADWRGLRPQIALADVRIHDREGREVLVLPAVTSVLSWRSLATLDVRMRSFTIEGPRLAVRRDARGGIHVAGIPLGDGAGDSGLADWVLAQNEIVVRDAEIEWTDEMRGAPPLALAALQFRLHNDGDRHDIGLSARPPAHLGAALDVRARLVGRSVTQPSAWNGRVFAELGATDLAGWRNWVDYPADVRRGQGALRLWMTLGEGRLTRATADVALTGVVARLGRDLPVLQLASVKGRVQGLETPRGYEFGVRNLALATAKGPEMRSTSFRARVEGAAPRRQGGLLVDDWKPASGAVNAAQLELAPLAHLAEFLPFPADLRKLLAALAPQGSVHDARFEWAGELPDAAKFKARARFSGLAMKSWGHLPGFAGLSGSLEATEKTGSLQLAAQKAELDLPRVFPEPRIALDTLTGQVDWTRGEDNYVSLRLGNLAFANAHAAGTVFGNYVFTGEGPGVVDLTAQLSRIDGRHTAKYLPLSTLMGERTRAWVAGAVQAGQSSDARVRLRGDLRDFPFPGGEKGQFQVAAKLAKAKLEVAEGWPAIEGIDGELNFENEKLEVVGRGGTILGARLSNVKASIASLTEPGPVLHVSGTADGPTQEFLRYVSLSPVTRYVGGATEALAASGNGRLALKLDLPLGELAKTRAQGEFRFSGNTITASTRLPPIERAAGTIAFTESGIEIREATGQLFGAPVSIGGGTQKDGGVAITARGTFTPESLRPVFDHPWRRYATGSAPYTATVASRGGRTVTSFESPLTGIALTLPPPFEKAAAEPMPLRVEVLPGEGGLRERISVTLAGSVHGEFLRSREAGEEMRLQRAAIAVNTPVGEAIRLPERRGLLVYGTLASLDLDRWRRLAAGDATGTGAASFDLKVATLDIFGKRVRTVALKGGVDAGGWSANIHSAEMSGDLAYRAEGAGKLTAHLAYFTIPEDQPGEKPVTAALTARDFPAVDLVADSFTFRGKKLGRVEIAADHEGANWRIHKIAIVNPDGTLTGKGLWQAGAASRTSLSLDFNSNNVGTFLDRLGNPDHIKGGKGKLWGTLAWSGDPVNVDYPSLGGELKLAMEDGQFLEIDPGLGKLVSLMSLQMLPRRISLDFRDVFSKGFQFDKIDASFAVRQGVMATKDFRMVGPAAEVEIRGDVDLARETQNLHVRVVPELGGTATAVMSVLKLNPMAGVAAMIAQKMLNNPIGQAFAYNYMVTGAWADPKVAKGTPPEPVAESQATTRKE